MIGGGLSGLVASTRLAAAGLPVVLLEKSSSLACAVKRPDRLAGGAPRFALTAELNREGKIAHIYVVSAAKLTAVS